MAALSSTLLAQHAYILFLLKGVEFRNAGGDCSVIIHWKLVAKGPVSNVIFSLRPFCFIIYMIKSSLLNSQKMSLLWKALVLVSLFTSVMSVIVYSGLFDTIFMELGFEYYAEKPSNFNMFFPRWVKMPLNTVVNLGYIIVGAYWCALTSVCLENKLINNFDAFIFYLFNLMSGFYGGIQALRIVTQIHRFGVLDQWSTLPFFMLVLIWGTYIYSGWNTPKFLCLTVFSLASYCLTLVTPFGFEIALGIHVLLAVSGAVIGYQKYPCRNAKVNFVLALLSCAGFIGLKLLDFELLEYHELFDKISGHFLSKIADIFQIHFVNKYFQSLLIERYRRLEAKQTKQAKSD